jgi:hypothetical protein
MDKKQLIIKEIKHILENDCDIINYFHDIYGISPVVLTKTENLDNKTINKTLIIIDDCITEPKNFILNEYEFDLKITIMTLESNEERAKHHLAKIKEKIRFAFKKDVTLNGTCLYSTMIKSKSTYNAIFNLYSKDLIEYIKYKG